MSGSATTDLARLRLSPADFHLILSLAQKLDCADLCLYVLDAARLPPNKRFQKLDGLILVINTKKDEVAAICKDLLEVIQRSKHHD